MSSSNHIWLLADAYEALATRLFLIRNAKKSIDIQTFIWGEDDLSFFIIKELVNAAKRGVKVRVLVDGWVGVDNPNLIRAFKELENYVESKHYNPPTRVICPSLVRLARAAFTNLRRMNHRMHAKCFVVDSVWGIVGGCQVPFF